MVAKNNSPHCTAPLPNQDTAQALAHLAGILESRGENAFRIHAYRLAAQVVQAHPEPLSEILDREGTEGLRKLPCIGRSLARTLEELISTGGLGWLEQAAPSVRSDGAASAADASAA